MRWFKRRVSPLEVSARHEACHAVVALSLHLPVASVDITRDSHYGGNTQWGQLTPLSPRESDPQRWADFRLEHLAVMLAPRVGTRDIDRHLKRSCSQDLRDAQQIAAVIVAGGVHPSSYRARLEIEGLLASAEEMAQDRLELYSSFVDELAALLVESRGEYPVGRNVLNPMTGRMERHAPR